jgi:hypothetical protein
MKSIEKVFLPKNATIPKEWIKEDADGYFVISFPSKTIDRIYDIHIEKESGLMGCTCLGFHFVGICSHIKKLRWILKKQGRATQAVSIEARLSLNNEYIKESHNKILNLLKEMPMTCDEIEVKIGYTGSEKDIGFTMSQRVSELFQMGLIEESGEERRTRRGRRAIVWAIS